MSSVCSNFVDTLGLAHRRCSKNGLLRAISGGGAACLGNSAWRVEPAAVTARSSRTTRSLPASRHKPSRRAHVARNGCSDTGIVRFRRSRDRIRRRKTSWPMLPGGASMCGLMHFPADTSPGDASDESMITDGSRLVAFHRLLLAGSLRAYRRSSGRWQRRSRHHRTPKLPPQPRICRPTGRLPLQQPVAQSAMTKETRWPRRGSD
jgi:hypothetical protein